MVFTNDSGEQEALLDVAALADLRELLGDTLPQLIAEFENQAQSLFAELDTLMASEPFTAHHCDEAARIVHVLKGSALSLHCRQLLSDCEEFNRLLNRPQPSELKIQRQVLEQTLSKSLVLLYQ